MLILEKYFSLVFEVESAASDVLDSEVEVSCLYALTIFLMLDIGIVGSGTYLRVDLSDMDRESDQ